jgi:site-specific recombinase XerD
MTDFLTATGPKSLTTNQDTPIPEELLWLANFDSERTRKTYQAAVRDFCAVVGVQGSEHLRSVTRAHVLQYREHLLREKNATHRTVRSRLAALSSLFQHLIERQQMTENPVHGIKRPKVNTQRGETVEITPQQVRAFLDVPGRETLQGVRDRALLHVFFYTGCRISEIATLRVKDFFEDAGYFVLDFTVKGGKKNRVAIHPELQRALQDYLARDGHLFEKEAPLFRPVKNGKPEETVTPRQFRRLFHKYRQQVGIGDNVTPHSARATFITTSLENGAPIEAVQKTVGHAHVSTTQIYDKRKFRYRDSSSLAVRY